MLIGTWFSIEIEKAFEHGYKILEIYKVHHFKHTTTESFELMTYLKIKQEASGVDTPELRKHA